VVEATQGRSTGLPGEKRPRAQGAELIFTGDELLRGDIVNTNQAYLGERLLNAGLFVTHALSVTDDLELIGGALREAASRRPAVLVVSGGLGPTADDLTREAIELAFNRELALSEALLDSIRRRFQDLGVHMAETNRKQALLPRGATAIPLVGTAPGFWFEEGPTLVVALPGVPSELQRMWEDTVEPLLRMREATGLAPGVVVRRLQLYGIGESSLADVLSDLPWKSGTAEIGTRAGLEGITLVLRSAPTPEGRARIATLASEIRARLGDKVYGENGVPLADVVGGLLTERGLTAVTAESCTGGLVAKKLTDTPGSSTYFLGGVITYSNELKESLLGVDRRDLQCYGAVSEQVASAMAAGVRESLGADCAIATTGIAGPGGGTAQKPVGLVWIATDVRGIIDARKYTMFRTRAEIRERTAHTALDLLRRRLLALT
jgi:nicotinamide-nucleotide amidase